MNKKYVSLLGLLLICFGSLYAIRMGNQKLPPGPYLQSCKDCYMISGNLHCQCRGAFDTLVGDDLLNARACKFSIINEKGKLKCIPYGPYLTSCGNCYMVGDTLSCQGCTTINGKPLQLLQKTNLTNVSACPYAIVNNNGLLNCLPYGPYLRHCSDCTIKDNVLHCRCSKSHSFISTSLDIKDCKSGTIDYYGGILECVKEH